MIKTQIQIPDQLYREAKRIAAEYEMSFAEVVRRALERVVPAYPRRPGDGQEWRLPLLDLGLKRDPFADPDWRERLDLGGSAARLTAAVRRRGRPARRR